MPPSAPPTHPHVRYRPYLDGLRGFAVLVVILYHAQLFGFTGGFVGVDVFFVISGFLITSILIRDLHDGRFSLLDFWERRIRRIFPALALVMACTVVAGYFFVLYPQEYHHMGSAVVAQSAFLSNMLFMVSDNYFTQETHYSPLIHTWSLSVEEQFYLLFPFLILFCVQLGRRMAARDGERPHFPHEARNLLIAFIALISIASLALNVYLVDMRAGASLAIPFTKGLSPIAFPTAGFYLLPSRAWELGFGALVALIALRLESVFWTEVLAIVSGILLLVPVFAFSDATWFPGLAALLPVGGAVGLIIANEQRVTYVGKALANRMLVGIGLISYSLYLWHVPVFVFARDTFAGEPGAIAKIALILLVVLLSVASYYGVEVPLRRRTLIAKRSSVFVLGAAAMIALFIAGALVYKNVISNTGLIPPAGRTVLALVDASRAQSGSGCVALSGGDLGGHPCVIGGQAKEPTFVVWGDSHAQALTPVFDSLAKSRGMQGVVFGDGGCAPVPGVWSIPLTDTCASERVAALDYIAAHDIKTIFLVARWNAYLMGGEDNGDRLRITDTASLPSSPAQSGEVLLNHLRPLLDRFSKEGRRVYVVTQVPEQFGFDPRTAFYAAARYGALPDPAGAASSTNAAYARTAAGVFAAVTSIPRVHILDTASYLCNDATCPLEDGTMLLYQDENHVSLAGAMKLTPLFVPLFR